VEYDTTLQSNGDIVVSGNFELVRYLPSGKLDTSFGTHGLAPTVGSAAGVAVEPNGDYLAVGEATTSTSFQGGDGATAVLIQPNGDIVAIGSSEDNATALPLLPTRRVSPRRSPSYGTAQAITEATKLPTITADT